MLIFRYLAKEVFVTLAGLTTILLLIFMSNQFMRYLTRAASGQIPAMFIMKLMMLELPNLMGLLLPLGFYVALLVAYGRLYAESEMTVLQACGYGPNQLLKHSLIMATVVAVLVLIIMIWASPVIAIERAKLLRTSGIQTLIKTIVPGRFRELPGGRQVFYVEEMNPAHTVAKNVFLAKLGEKDGKQQWNILWADKAFAKTDAQTFEDYVVFEEGKAYQGIPGSADYEIAEFGNYEARLPHPVVALKNDIRTSDTASLLPLNNPDTRKAAELQWRLAVPLMVLTLTLVAVPLSRVNPRAGKFAKLLPAIVLYIIYANFIFVARDWLIVGKIPVWLGMWWLHLAVALLGLFLIWRNQVKLA
ncbi:MULTISPECIES: LPS export ABC transporter permease LptF [Legionella]|uniref:Lipopolysaccharide export system permease protein LptF n=1 Tax=Legionella septentrionalis TaxID=2498109 RepID=A0A433JLS8_9GAMM|nr:LPS export ABC transporter permease LptF [Legionella septentrionalis]MCP0914103.1 LPS export ABC transporter permease LptF [Legionella sp. 27cVA30]RUQ90739.1 LPS export ABC transporter permease LptF [Legionella septentrionalis]RUQ99956.1 LPS export ABC transporter permease LptF [Legionella septentrionalis]RUR10200.1 LPS export ABC transporter permease LptF [Legionella septentrionalis]RUR15788.1 LPS export ABC transporter permease LptF [Legionella septentrionalis]